MDERARTALLFVAGYGCYQAASSTGYLTAMGTVSTNLGFVTQLPFMLAGCVSGAAAAFALAWFGRRRTHPLVWLLATCYAALAALPLVSFPLAALGVSGDAAAVVLGSVRGACTSAISIGWVALFVAHAGPELPALYLGTFALSSLGGLALRAVPSQLDTLVVSVALLGASFACALPLVSRAREKAASGELVIRETRLVSPRAPQGRLFYATCLCLLVCEFVVGVTNTAMFDSAFSAAVTGVNMSCCMLAAVGVLAVIYAAMRRAPSPTLMYKFCMPVLLAVFSVMPFAADGLGPVAGFLMICCYDVVALAFSIYLVSYLQEGGYAPYRNFGVFAGVSNCTLLLGLLIGMGLNALWSARGVPLLTLLAFVAIYPVGIVFLFVQRSRARARAAGVPVPSGPGENECARDDAARTACEASSGTPTVGPDEAAAAPATADDLVRDYYAERMVAFAREYRLTPRESQVCAHLVRGRSVKICADELGITENTAWTHIKNLYAKCGVGTKQELMQLFEGRPRE